MIDICNDISIHRMTDISQWAITHTSVSAAWKNSRLSPTRAIGRYSACRAKRKGYRRGAQFAYNRGKSVNHLLEHKFSLQAPSANAGWADGVMDVCWGRSGPPVAAWPSRHGDPWSLCFCSRSFGRRTLPEEDCLFWKFTSQRWMA